MKRITEATRRFLNDESGIAATEYGLLVALVAVAFVAILRTFGTNLSSWFGRVTTSLTSTAP